MSLAQQDKVWGNDWEMQREIEIKYPDPFEDVKPNAEIVKFVVYELDGRTEVIFCCVSFSDQNNG